MTRIIFEVFDPWSRPDVDGARDVFRTELVGREVTPQDVEDEVRNLVEAIDNDYDVAREERAELAAKIVHAMAYAYAIGRVDESKKDAS